MMIIKRCYKSSFYYLHKFYIIKKRKNHIPSKKLLFFLWGVYNEIVHNKIGDFMRKIRRKREKRKQKIIIIIVFLFLIIMTSGYAAFSANITIKAKGNIKCNPKIVKEKLLENLTTVGEVLYADEYEEGRYVYKGENPNNYLKFNDELWRIVSLEKDGTIKILKTTKAATVSFDEIGNRDKTSNGEGETLCQTSEHGCSVWAATQNMVGSPSEFTLNNESGTVLKDATINTYLNNNYYTSLNNNSKELIVSHNYYIGGVNWGEAKISELIKSETTNEKKYIWNGKVGLLSFTDVLKSNIDDNDCKMSSNPYDENDADILQCNLSTSYIDKNFNNVILINPRNYTAFLSQFYNDNWINDYASSTQVVVHPVVFLNSNIKLCGLGTKNNPYEIE